MQGTETLFISVNNPAAGDYQFVVAGRRTSDGALDQQTIDISVREVGASQYNYPQGRGGYGEGDLVTGLDGNIYACQIPNWCNGSKTYFASGTGLAWRNAWTQVGVGTPPPSTSPADYVYPNGRGQYQHATHAGFEIAHHVDFASGIGLQQIQALSELATRPIWTSAYLCMTFLLELLLCRRWPKAPLKGRAPP